MKELIILGKGDSRKHCPFDDSCGDIWGVNNVYRHPEVQGKRIDKLFAFDPAEYLDIEGMKEVAPIVSWQDYADEKYPLEQIIKEFKSAYFCNSICYMLALAIYQGYKKLKIYGVDHAIGSEYSVVRSGLSLCGRVF